jgi:hypothetical protein
MRDRREVGRRRIAENIAMRTCRIMITMRVKYYGAVLDDLDNEADA